MFDFYPSSQGSPTNITLNQWDYKETNLGLWQYSFWFQNVYNTLESHLLRFYFFLTEITKSRNLLFKKYFYRGWRFFFDIWQEQGVRLKQYYNCCISCSKIMQFSNSAVLEPTNSKICLLCHNIVMLLHQQLPLSNTGSSISQCIGSTLEFKIRAHKFKRTLIKINRKFTQLFNLTKTNQINK